MTRPILIREEWRACETYPWYAVSNRGRIKRMAGYYCREDRILSVFDGKVNLRRPGSGICTPLGPLILRAFVGPPPSPKSVARHLDDDRSHNWVENLSWGSQNDNVQDAIRNGKFGPKGRKQTAEERERRGAANRGKVRSTESRARYSAAMTPERRARQSLCNQGINSTLAKLTNQDILEIRREYKRGTNSSAILAKRFSIHRDYIYDIVHRKTWKHI